MQVVIRSDPHKKMNEYMEKYSHLRTKRMYIQPKNNARARTYFCFRKLATSCGFLQSACAWIQQDARTSSVVFTFMNIFHWKFCRQNYSTGQIKIKRGVTLSVWIVYIIVWPFFRLHRFYPLLVISIVSDSFRLFPFFQ